MLDEDLPGRLTDVTPRLDLRGVTVKFGGIIALDDVSVTVRPGEVLGLIGPNGAGKTTLFDVIAGVRIPDRGSVWLEGSDVTRAAATTRARKGMRRTFQRVQTFGWLTVEDNVLAAVEWRGGSGGFLADLVSWRGRRKLEQARRARVEGVLVRCGLGDVSQRLASSLPIGTARMVELARAIVDGPTVLLLDEPASGLDDQEMNRLAQQILNVRDSTGCSIVLVEHNAAFVMGLSDRIVVLDQGRVLAEGRPEEIQQNQAVRDAYLGEIVAIGKSVVQAQPE
jgi:branched-chain amino acid transport system ATP-binding protein